MEGGGLRIGGSGLEEPGVLLVGEGDDGEAELAEEEGAGEGGGFAHLGEGFGTLEGFAGLDADERVLGVGGVDGEDGGEADGDFAGVGVVEDELVAFFEAAEVGEGLGIFDAVPGGFAVADEVVEGVLSGFGLEEEGHGGISVHGCQVSDVG